MVAALFVAALLALWTTGASVVAREHRRSEAKVLLDRAGDELAARGRGIIARAGEFPELSGSPSRGTSSIRALGSGRPRLSPDRVSKGDIWSCV